MVEIFVRWKICRQLLTVVVVFLVTNVSVIYGYGRKTTVVIFPFKYNCDSNCLVRGIEDVMQSELIRSGYFTVAEQERTYEFVRESVLNNFIKIENVDVEAVLPKANIVDLFARIDPKIIIQTAEKLKADFVIKGALNQFGHWFRADIEVIHVKTKKTLSVLVGECEFEEEIPEVLEQLSDQTVNVCKGVNVQKEISYIQNSYQQGDLTYEETTDRLKNISSETPKSLPIHCALFSHYYGHQEMRNSLIEEGEEIIKLFAGDDEGLSCLSLLGIDPFYELANVYRDMGRLNNAIDVYNRAIMLYPLNHIKYYKELGGLYKIEGKGELAIHAFKQVLSLNQADYEARLNLASVYEINNDLLGAIEQYQCCLKYAKNIAESSRVKALIERLQSKRDVKEK